MRSQRRLVSPLSAVNLAPNTFIGGVAAEIPTKADLATKLAITENDISYFSAIGSDIEARIDTNWILGGKFRYNNITFLYDYDGKIINSLVDLYSNQTIKEIYLPGILGITESGFKYTNQCVLYYLPKAEFFGATTGNENIFVKNGQITKRIYCHPSNSTSNNGGVEGDLQLAIDYGSEVIYVQNYTTPNIITNLSIGTIYATALQINFTPPSSVNDIDYYEVYVNGVYNKNIVSGDYITGLNPDTTYTITVKAVDIYYNKSGFSNSVSDTTKSEAQFQTETISYKNRVLADGGIVQNIGAVDTRIQRLKELSLYSSLFHANSDKGGFKIDASNLIEKAYSYPDATTDLVQITSTRKPTLINDGLLFDSVDDELSKTLTSNSLSSFSVIWKIKPTTGNYFPLFSFGAWESFNLHSENGGKIYAGITIGARFAIAEAMLNNVLATYTFTYDQPSGIAKLYRNETLLGSKSMPAPVALSKLQMSNVGGSHYELIVLTKAISLTELQNVLKL